MYNFNIPPDLIELEYYCKLFDQCSVPRDKH